MIRTLEISWLIIAIITVVIACYQLVTEGWQSAVWMLAVTAVAVIMYRVRKKQRLIMEKREQDAAKYH